MKPTNCRNKKIIREDLESQFNVAGGSMVVIKNVQNVDLKRHLAGTEIAGDRTSTLEEL